LRSPILAAAPVRVAYTLPGLVALAAKEHGAALATQDARARGTCDAVGVEVIVVT
jgi:hypothetical protein